MATPEELARKQANQYRMAETGSSAPQSRLDTTPTGSETFAAQQARAGNYVPSAAERVKAANDAWAARFGTTQERQARMAQEFAMQTAPLRQVIQQTQAIGQQRAIDQARAQDLAARRLAAFQTQGTGRQPGEQRTINGQPLTGEYAGWQADVVKNFPSIGEAGTVLNERYVSAFKNLKSKNLPFDPLTLAQSVDKQVRAESAYRSGPGADNIAMANRIAENAAKMRESLAAAQSGVQRMQQGIEDFQRSGAQGPFKEVSQADVQQYASPYAQQPSQPQTPRPENPRISALLNPTPVTRFSPSSTQIKNNQYINSFR